MRVKDPRLTCPTPGCPVTTLPSGAKKCPKCGQLGLPPVRRFGEVTK